MVQIIEELEVQQLDLTAEILVSCIDGAVNRKVSTGDKEELESLKEGIKNVVSEQVEDCGSLQ